MSLLESKWLVLLQGVVGKDISQKDLEGKALSLHQLLLLTLTAPKLDTVSECCSTHQVEVRDMSSVPRQSDGSALYQGFMSRASCNNNFI